jgi:inosine-uridine nucleoside N-ribohydrolase
MKHKFLQHYNYSLSLLAAGIILQFAIISCSPTKAATTKPSTAPIPIIFETDMGNDVDDALALDMLYKYLDKGKVNVLAISTNKDNPYSAPFLQIMNNWYGYPNIPIGKVKRGINSTADAKDYAQAVYDFKQNGQYVFRKYARDSTAVMESVALYRKILSTYTGNDIRIVSVGFSTNLARLLESGPDSYSSLSGAELIRQKVKTLYLMAGNFDSQLKYGEYNVIKDSIAAKKIFAKWPTAISVSPFEVGIQILYPATSIQNDLNWVNAHPLKVAYESYRQMPYDRPCWDPTALLDAVEADQNYFKLSTGGYITVDPKENTDFVPDEHGPHRFLMVDSIQSARIRDRIVELVKTKPLHR